MLTNELTALKSSALKLLEAYAEIAQGGTETGLSTMREAIAELIVTERKMREVVENEQSNAQE
jgi:hypothetical protein